MSEKRVLAVGRWLTEYGAWVVWVGDDTPAAQAEAAPPPAALTIEELHDWYDRHFVPVAVTIGKQEALREHN